MRKRMVTRTIISTVCNVMCVDTTAGECFNKTVEVSGTFKDSDKLFKAVKDVADTETEKCVHIVETHEKESLYGMPEQEFMKYAKLLPPRTKATEETTEE